MRLFLRSYCEYISADPDKALNDYEFFTLGSKTETKSFVPRSEDLPDPTPKINEKELNLPQVPTTKIITIVVTVVCLISAFFFLRYLGSDSDESASEDGVSQTNGEEVLSLEQPVQYSKLPNDSPLNNSNFLITKRLSENSIFLEESPKYVLRVEALARTKININNSVKDKPESTNEIIEAGEIRTFFISKQISFDFWSASHIDVQINDIKLNNYFGSRDQSIRGTFDITDQKLWYAIYPQTAG